MGWFLMLVLGGFFMWAITYSERDWLDAVLVRAAGCSFTGAGVLGANGVIGALVSSIMAWALSTADDLSRAALGGAIVGIIGALVGILWVLAMLPDKMFKWDAPDWLVISGFFFPSLMVQVTGPVGEFLRAVIIDFAANGMIGIVQAGFGLGS